MSLFFDILATLLDSISIVDFSKQQISLPDSVSTPVCVNVLDTAVRKDDRAC